MSLPSFWLVIPAAGIGSRMQAACPKQYLSVAGKTILERTLECFLEHPSVQGIVLALAEHDRWWPQLSLAVHPRISTVVGGAERADSVLNALLALPGRGAKADDWVLVHDAARPLLTREDLDRLLTRLAADPVGGLLAVPARDTLKHVSADGCVLKTIDRSVIWHALTPQMFRLGLLQHALAAALQAQVAVTDESSAMEWAGFTPRVVEGLASNIKITCPEDLLLL
ncbi:2-C-methyl-D-erythritol 4-phosphate cytidylyltransferase [Pseudomonas sp. C27(2019)]|uniref:2-C-methyl-D-erythritol 4-phosphate cytidylyltransferase n=1 Tax=Pseudomonas sp. C27(2019) TaxID=2604941 RepID=UPI0012489041|nr:2-C-methyl-D-erythritol 4-phosphate cytidylyltransferase [Pseudomonas sp. C27(2019)]QEY58477.1 2-C-methyl-D-erythritol 4-phosphate cytidylyltransferase [Pseudomonas sp. C27(2019)]